MEMDTGEALLRAWLELAAMIWNRRMVSGMTFNEAVVSNLLLYRQQQDPAHPMTATELCEKTNLLWYLGLQMNKEMKAAMHGIS